MKRLCLITLSGAMLFSLLVSASGCSAGAGNDSAADTTVTEAPTNVLIDDTAYPDFTVTDGEGNPVKLSEFFGKPIVLNFWASWCPPCKSELPDFENAYQTYGDDVTFLMVNMTDGSRETVAGVKSFLETNGYTFPVYYDVAYDAAYTYGVSSIPQTYFIDAEGTLVSKATGMISAAQLEQGIAMIYSPET